jgi:CRISPR-associated protein Csb1
MSKKLTYEILSHAVAGTGAAFRSVTKLQPVGQPGDRIFPATYKDGKYATEKRRLRAEDGTAGEPVDCVLLNSVPSEANHAEEALLEAVRRGRIQLPLIEVDFSGANPELLKPLPNLTSLEVPHRLADAILRDSLLEDGTRFEKSEYASRWRKANLWNATPVYELCPTALVFGLWGSPEKPGGLGAKFERAFVSEIVAVDTDPVADRFGFRIDPVSASSQVMLKRNEVGFEAVDPRTKGAVRPSEINHGNIIAESKNGGVRCSYAEQTTVISIGALRKLRFPVDGKTNYATDDCGRTVLAALGLCAAVLASERGTSLRSRCHLVATERRTWELVDRPGEEPREFHVSGDEAAELLQVAVERAETMGLKWMQEKLVLRPVPELVKLISESQKIQATTEEKEA